MDHYTIREFGDSLSELGMACFVRTTRTFTYFNAAFQSIFERNSSQLYHQPACLLSLFPDKDLSFIEKSYAAILTQGQIYNTELILDFGSGRQKNVLVDATEVDSGKTLVFIVRDITRRKSQEEYLIKHSAQKDTLLDMLTHNLSSHLFLNKDLLSIMSKDLGNNSEAAGKIIGLLLDNTHQCIDIVTDFLQREHFESTRVVANFISFDVIEKINVVLDKFRELNASKTFFLTCSMSTLIANSDPVKFFQIIQNLLSNAVKFTGPAGTVEIGLECNETHFIIMIKDDGIGLSKELHPKLFKERLKGRQGLAGEFSNGIGLFVTQRLVEMLGGTISLDSGYRGGSSFRVELPLKAAVTS